jgi:hypothetical protein
MKHIFDAEKSSFWDEDIKKGCFQTAFFYTNNGSVQV